MFSVTLLAFVLIYLPNISELPQNVVSGTVVVLVNRVLNNNSVKSLRVTRRNYP